MSNAVVQIKRPDHAAEERQDPLRAERAALAAAIDKEGEARGVLDRAEQALRRGRDVVASAETELDRAKKLVTAAQDRNGRQNPQQVRRRLARRQRDQSARLRVQMCEDSVCVAAAATERLEQDVSAAASACAWATNNRIAAANSVLATIADRLLESARTSRLAAKSAEAALSELLNNDAGGPEFPDDVGASIRAREERTAELGARREKAVAFFRTRATEAESEAEAEAIRGIKAFRARLSADPSAPPPALLP